jgi:hypothetical protein
MKVTTWWRLTVVGSVVCLVGCGTPLPPADARADDRMCEVVVSQKLHQVADVWAKRYGMIVWCASVGETKDSAGRPQGEITVTVSPANGQDGVGADELGAVERQLRAALEGIVKREGWEAKYPIRFLQATP